MSEKQLSKSNSILTTTTIYSGVFFAALLLNTMPPLMLEFQKAFNLSISKSGLIPASHSLGTVLANLSAVYLLGRLGTIKIAYAGLISAFSGLVFITLGNNFVLLCIGIFLLAFAFGLTISAYSTQISYLPESLRNYSLFHSFFGLGGFVAPLFVGFTASKYLSYKNVYLLYFLFLAVYLILLIISKPINHKTKEPNFKKLAKKVFTKVNVSLMLLAGFYASAEMSIVIWSGNFFSIAHKTTTEKVSIYISLFWLMFTIGRMFGGYQIKKFGGIRNSKIMAGISICFLLAVIFLNKFISPIAFTLIGLSVATIFPSIHHILNLDKDEEIRGMLNAALFLTVSIAGFLFVPIVGAVAEQNLTFGMLINTIPLIAIIFVLKKNYVLTDKSLN